MSLLYIHLHLILHTIGMLRSTGWTLQANQTRASFTHLLRHYLLYLLYYSPSILSITTYPLYHNTFCIPLSLSDQSPDLIDHGHRLLGPRPPFADCHQLQYIQNTLSVSHSIENNDQTELD